jgi:hypothetical protein
MGQKRRRAFAALADRARAWHELYPNDDLEPEHVLSYVCDYLAGGGFLSALADELGIGRPILSRYVNALTPDAKERLEAARRSVETADAHAEAGYLVLEGAESREEARLARAKSDYRRFLAGAAARHVYGTGPAVQINLAAHNLHLDALRVSPHSHLASSDPPPALPTVETDDAKLLTDNDLG